MDNKLGPIDLLLILLLHCMFLPIKSPVSP